MGIRETLNKKPAVSGGLVCGAVVVAAVVILTLGSNRVPAKDKRAFFSDDDGKTFFVDDIDKIVPYDHEGKPACRAMVYQFEGKPPFVGYLLRYSVEGQAKLTKAMSDATTREEMPSLRNSSSEIKKPGDAKWVPLSGAKGEAISMNPVDSGGDRATYLSP